MTNNSFPRGFWRPHQPRRSSRSRRWGKGPCRMKGWSGPRAGGVFSLENLVGVSVSRINRAQRENREEGWRVKDKQRRNGGRGKELRERSLRPRNCQCLCSVSTILSAISSEAARVNFILLRRIHAFSFVKSFRYIYGYNTKGVWGEGGTEICSWG